MEHELEEKQMRTSKKYDYNVGFKMSRNKADFKSKGH